MTKMPTDTPDARALEMASARIRLVDLVLGGAEASDDRSPWRTAVHESGHVLTNLVDAVDFTRVEVFGAGGALTAEGLAPYEPNSRESRMASDVAGAIAEEIVFGDVELRGVEDDFRVALVRAFVNDPALVNPNHDGLVLVRREVRRVRRMLRRRKRVLVKLACVLQDARSLSRPECVRVVRDAGSRVLLRPRFSALMSDAEWRDCNRARREVEASASSHGSRSLDASSKQLHLDFGTP